MGPSMPQILIVLLVIVVIFGAAKLPQIGKGMGEAIKNFKKSVHDVEDATDITPVANKREAQPQDKDKNKSEDTKS